MTGSANLGSLTIKSIVTSSHSLCGGSQNSRFLYFACRVALFLLQLSHRLIYLETLRLMSGNTKFRRICSAVRATLG